MNTATRPLGDPTATDAEWTTVLGGIRLRFGRGARGHLREELGRLGVERPLLVSDPGVRVTGRVDELLESLQGVGMTAAIFDAVDENPTTEHVAAGTAVARGHRADALVAVGGGSAMDAAKGINFIFTHGGSMEDYWGSGLARGPMLPSIGIPTTAGTGSEAQSYALISRPDDHRKMACGADGARFRTVLLDPELLATVPREVAKAAGLDAVTHAFESHVSTRSNPISRLYSRAAWQHLQGALRTYLASPDDATAAGAMMLGAHLSGAAIESSMLGAAHACANPLTARLGLTHGIAVGILLPHVVRFNGESARQGYIDLCGSSVDPAGVTADLLSLTATPSRLRDHDVPEELLEQLAADAAHQWTAKFNPRPVDASQLLWIYEQAY